MVVGRLTQILIALLLVGVSASSVFAFGEVEVLLSKEAKVESSRTSLIAAKERNARVITELLDLMQKKQDVELTQIEDRFAEQANLISDSAFERREEMNRQLQAFVLRYTDSPSVAHVYLRLAELYYNQAKEDFAEAYQRFDQQPAAMGAESGYGF